MTRRKQIAFTLLEVLAATAVFSVLSLALFAVFRTATRTQETAFAEAALIQQSRFASDLFRRDVTNIFFRDETAYNVTITRLIEDMEQARLQAERTGDFDSFFAIYGDPNRDRRDQNPTIGNPFERGRLIDLQFAATSRGGNDLITFATLAPPGVGRPLRPWGLSRVEWRVEGDVLLRTETPVEVQPRNQLGERVALPVIPDIVAVATGVQRFELSYAFWYDFQWYETNQWDSTLRQIRNGNFTLGDYEGDVDRRGADPDGFGPGSPGFNQSLNNNMNEPLDRLPQYIRMTLEIADERNPGRTQTTTTIIRVPGAVETFTPSDALTIRQREQEQLLRDEFYTPFRPGVPIR